MENPATMQDITTEKEILTETKPDYVDLVHAILCEPKSDVVCIIAEDQKGTYLKKHDIIETDLGKAVVISTLDYISTTNTAYEFIRGLYGYEAKHLVIGAWKYKETRWN